MPALITHDNEASLCVGLMQPAWSSPHQIFQGAPDDVRLCCLDILTSALSLIVFLFQIKTLSEPKSIGVMAIPGSTLIKLIVRWTARINSASKYGKVSDAAQDLLGM